MHVNGINGYFTGLLPVAHKLTFRPLPVTQMMCLDKSVELMQEQEVEQEEQEVDEEHDVNDLLYKADEHGGETYVCYTPEFYTDMKRVFQCLTMMTSYFRGNTSVSKTWHSTLENAAYLFDEYGDMLIHGLVCVHRTCLDVCAAMAERCSVFANRVQVEPDMAYKVESASAAAYMALRFTRAFLPDKAEPSYVVEAQLNSMMTVMQPFCPPGLCTFMERMEAHEDHDFLYLFGDTLGWDEGSEGEE